MTAAGFPHWDTLGSTLGCQLPEAYRRLPRPSSALGAKASTLRSSFTSHNNFGSYHTPRTHHDDHEDHHDEPCARWQRLKMLASTVQFSNNNQHQHTHPTNRQGRAVPHPEEIEPATHPAPPPPQAPRTPHTVAGSAQEHQDETRTGAGSLWLLPQDPTACDGRRSTLEPPPRVRTTRARAPPQPAHRAPTGATSTSRQHPTGTTDHHQSAPRRADQTYDEVACSLERR